MIIRTSMRMYACSTHKHNAMRAIKHRPRSTIKHRETKHKVKQGFLIKECFLPLDICISPMNFSPYECARCRITPPKNVHMSHKMTKHTGILSGILSPFLLRIDKWIKRKEGKKRRYEQGQDAWGVQEEWENETQPKEKKNLKKMLQSIKNMTC